MKHLFSYTATGILTCGFIATLHPEPHTSKASEAILPAAAQAEIGSVEAEINTTEVNTLATSSEPSLDRSQQLILLGKLLFYDRNLSVARNEACAFCHMPEAGFTGPVSALNQTTVSYPGSIRTRFGGRNPQTHTYASFSCQRRLKIPHIAGRKFPSPRRVVVYSFG
jgi:cytochrome c peroxidase